MDRWHHREVIEVPSAAVKSADRVLDVFEVLSAHRSGLTHSELSEKLDIPKSSLTLLLRNMAYRGYLSLDHETKRFALGRRFAELSRDAANPLDLISAIQPLLATICAECGETSALNILDNMQTRVLATAESTHRLLSQMRVGDVAPLYATSSGKAMLARLDDDSVDQYLSEVPLTAMTPNTITSPDELRRQLEMIRGGEVAEVIEEFTPGIVGLAVSIASGPGVPLAAINVSMPAIRYGSSARETIVAALRAAQAHVAQRVR